MGRQILRRDKQWLVTRLKRRRDERNEVKRRDLTKIRKRRRKKENDDTVQKGRRVKSQNDEKKTRLSERSEKKKQSKKKQKKSKQNLQIQEMKEMHQLLYSLRNILLVKSWEEERSLLLKKLLQNDLVESILLRLLIKRTLVKICNDFVLKLRFSHE